MKKIFTLAVMMAMVLVCAMQAHADLTNLGVDSAGNRLIYDTDLDITWYDYTNSYTTWQNQLNWAAGLTVTTAAATYTDWRLPIMFDESCSGYNCTNSEMGHLYYTELGNTAGSGGFTNTGEFQNVVSSLYWTGMEYFDAPGGAWDFSTSRGGYQGSTTKSNVAYAIAVRPGLAVATVCGNDLDGDGVMDDGDCSGTVGDNLCTGGNTTNCDDNCINTPNPTQGDVDNDGIGDVCDNCTDVDIDSYAIEGGICGAVDCDDGNSVINPDTPWYEDADGDGYGNPAVAYVQCTQPAGPPNYVLNNLDYDDTDPNIGLPVKVTGAATILAAYNAESNGDTISVIADSFTENIDIDINKSIAFSGGYDGAFATNAGNTMLIGDIIISNGTVTIQSGTLTLVQ